MSKLAKVKTKSPPVHYVDNKKFNKAMIEYVTAYRKSEAEGSDLPKISNYIGSCISKIANKLSNSPNFSGYSFKEEMISDGIENCFQYLHKFNIDKYDNPFAYYTQVNYYAFIRRIQKENKQQYIKHKSYINASVMNELVSMSPEDHGHFTSHYKNNGMEKSDEIIAKFEEKLNSKKKKKDEPE